MKCKNCQDSYWVCEEHNDKPWAGGMPKGFTECCGGAGMPCPECNTNEAGVMPKMQDGFEVLIDSTGYHRPPKLVKE